VKTRKEVINMVESKVAASVTVYRVADMTPKGRKEVCAWLRRLCAAIQRHPESFDKTFRARYMYIPNGCCCPMKKAK